MAFGLINGPATFSIIIDALFGPECQPHVFGYLDDVIIITKTFEEHMYWIEFVLRRIADAGLAISSRNQSSVVNRSRIWGIC